jgi:hypothetical protein
LGWRASAGVVGVPLAGRGGAGAGVGAAGQPW